MGARARLTRLTRLARWTLACCLVGIAPAAATVPYAAPDASDVPTRVVAPADLARGDDTTVPYVQDGAVRADGRRLRLRVAADRAQLLGRVPGRGWAVAVGRGRTSRVLLVRRTASSEVRHTRFTPYVGSSEGASWRLSRDGGLLLSTHFDRGGAPHAVLDLDGRRRVAWYSGSYSFPLDVDSGRVVMDDTDDDGVEGVFDRTVPRRMRFVVARATAAFIAHDLVFPYAGGRSGPTSLTTPDAPAWMEPFEPLAVSPDSATVLGLRLNGSPVRHPAVLDVRRMADGVLLDSVRLAPPLDPDTVDISSTREQTVAWEDDTTYVFQVGTAPHAVLVRCTIAQRCERASDVGGDISFAHETFMWW